MGVDAKFFFSIERTFLHYSGIALLFILISAGFKSAKAFSNVGHPLIFLLGGAVTLLNSYRIYRSRISYAERKSNQKAFQDGMLQNLLITGIVTFVFLAKLNEILSLEV
jgi:hypothetical protein